MQKFGLMHKRTLVLIKTKQEKGGIVPCFDEDEPIFMARSTGKVMEFVEDVLSKSGINPDELVIVRMQILLTVVDNNGKRSIT